MRLCLCGFRSKLLLVSNRLYFQPIVYSYAIFQTLCAGANEVRVHFVFIRNKSQRVKINFVCCNVQSQTKTKQTKATRPTTPATRCSAISVIRRRPKRISTLYASFFSSVFWNLYLSFYFYSILCSFFLFFYFYFYFYVLSYRFFQSECGSTNHCHAYTLCNPCKGKQGRNCPRCGNSPANWRYKGA